MRLGDKIRYYRFDAYDLLKVNMCSTCSLANN